MQTLLSKADRALGRLDGSIQTLPNPDLFVFMYVRKEAVLSSQIEGTQASLNDLLAAEAKMFDRQHPNDVHEVVNYVQAFNHGLARLRELPLSLRLIRELHEKLMTGVRGHNMTPGEFRTTQNWIGAGGCSLTQALFVPPPHTEFPSLLGDFESFLHSTSDIPPLIKIGLAHAQFETIHPFLDGNGRVGRLLITFLLCEKEILLKPVLYLSFYLRKHRSVYYELLQGTRDRGDYESWLKFFLRGVSEVSLEATETARAIVELREQHRLMIAENFGLAARNGVRLLEYMFQNPFLTVSEVATQLGVTFVAANKIVQRLVAAGILKEITGRTRNRQYMYDPYITLFRA
ncbi:MAG TPA: Fic family protein [Rhizomicrobium sp.]|nr:Fic family protein [Rhizomicrobium sp.]